MLQLLRTGSWSHCDWWEICLIIERDGTNSMFKTTTADAKIREIDNEEKDDSNPMR
jgi:hypothetical protein